MKPTVPTKRTLRVKKPIPAEVEPKQTKQLLGTVANMMEAQQAVRDRYKVHAYDKDFPMDKIKDAHGVRAVEGIKATLAVARDETPRFLNGLLIPRDLLAAFYMDLDTLCEQAIDAAKHHYCEMQQFQASQEMVGATLKAIFEGPKPPPKKEGGNT